MIISVKNLVVLFLFLAEGVTAEELKFLQTVFRHGDRVPDDVSEDFYPNDPYNEKDYYPIPYGGLTDRGEERSFELGKFYRKSYGELLRDKNSVEFNCNIVPRTKRTAELVATGLFTSDPNKKWSESFELESIPINAPSAIEEAWFYFSSIGYVCSNAGKEQEKVQKTDPVLIEYLEQNKEFYDYLALHAGTNRTFELAYMLYMTLGPQLELGLELPEWTKTIFPEGKLKEEAPMVFIIRGFTDELKRFGGGLWLRMWLENIDKFVAGNTTDKKAIFWSGHDMNIADLLVALEIFDEPHIPPYNSAIILELHEIQRQYYVKVLYKQHDTAKALRVLGCPDILCPLEEFKHQVAGILPRGGSGEICGDNIINSLKKNLNFPF